MKYKYNKGGTIRIEGDMSSCYLSEKVASDTYDQEQHDEEPFTASNGELGEIMLNLKNNKYGKNQKF